ncbi:MAG TPA: IS66 family transposase, partial [Clostridia bacterium]|nr:IS66 family transposase [Clostridia bacterium]
MEKINVEGLSPEVTAYIAHLEAQVEQLEEKLARLQKAMFGPSSEKRRYVLEHDPNQLCLFNEAEVEADKHAP